MHRVNGYPTIFWLMMTPVSMVTGWIQSVAYISALKLWAFVSGHWSARQTARVELTQQEARHCEAELLEKKVVNELVNRTNIEPADEWPEATTAANQEIETMIRTMRDQVDQLCRRFQAPQRAVATR